MFRYEYERAVREGHLVDYNVAAVKSDVEPLAAIASATVPVVIQLGRTTLDIRKQRFAWRDVMSNNPVSYIVDANEKLAR